VLYLYIDKYDDVTQSNCSLKLIYTSSAKKSFKASTLFIKNIVTQMINSNSFDDNNDIINQQNDYKLIDKIDQRLIDLLIKGYTNKKIALEAGSPLSTIQRRIRKIFENEYIHRKNELNHRKLGLRKGYLLISLKGDFSDKVTEKISAMKGITCISLVTFFVYVCSEIPIIYSR